MTRGAIVVSGLHCSLFRKPIKNIHVYVRPPDGRVEASIPLELDIGVIRAFVLSRADAIKARQKAIREHIRQTPRRYVDGESFYVWGVRYTLVTREARNCSVKLDASRLLLARPPGADPGRCARRLDAFYRRQLRDRIGTLLPVWCKRMGLNEKPAVFCQMMKTRWGSCSPSRNNIRLNIALAKKPPACLEFILVHELCHFFVRHHNKDFFALLDRYLPDWATIRRELNDFILDPYQ